MIYFEPRFGLGNIIQTTPAVSWLAERSDVRLVVSSATADYVKAVFGKRFECVPRPPKGSTVIRSINPGEFKQGGEISEVQANLRKAGCGNWQDADVRSSGFCGYVEHPDTFDLVIANGYNKTKNLTDWEAKTYERWPEVIQRLPPGLRIASVGSAGEAIPGTVDLTGIGLAETFGVIKKSRCFASNDTGLYHAAAVMGVPGVVLFTFTDKAKNYDAVFHRTIGLVARYMPCSPCQLKGKRFWLSERPRCGWECRNIQPDFVAETILSRL